MRLQGPHNALLTTSELGALLRPFVDGDVLSLRLMHDGAFAALYDVRLADHPSRVVVKVQKFANRAAIEQRQLAELRKYSPVRVPEVYACLAATSGLPEALVLEHLPGVEGRCLGNLTAAARFRVARSMVDTLLALHGYEHADRYGELDGPWCDRWVEYYRSWLEAVFAELQSRVGSAQSPDPLVLQVGEQSLACIEDVFTARIAPAVFVHGDFCLGNVLFDPDTYEITGLIDPLDSVWGDPERDLVHLAKSEGHRYGLLGEYQQRVPPDEKFWLRYWFYMFWTWVSYDASIGLRDDAWYHTCAERLQEALDREQL
jgi:aminoglycoside phosphotransferase (APT) family kinase protein